MPWDTPLGLLREELRQREDEGCAIPSAFSEEIASLGSADSWNEERVGRLYDALMALADDPELAAREPNELNEIRKLRPDGPRDLSFRPSDDEALDRFHGAWTGRAVGCALGKPVEGMGMRWEGGRFVGRKRIRSYLEHRGDWPLDDFFSGRDAGDGLGIGCERSQRERIAYMEPDDDIHYSLTGLGVLEQHGPDFRWNDVARFWLDRMPLWAICTAETQAIENYIAKTRRMGGSVAAPEYTRRHRNPYREWIGAQIRSDGWAWAAAGKPEIAAEFAHRDACWTHERNGIYGEMLFAAIQAAAFVEHDPTRLVEIGLSEIPRDCRLARRVRECLEWVHACADFEACMDRIEGALGSMSPVHTINNALICVLSLFYGEMDTTRAVATAVMCGHDTDCNGATVGSIVGAARGRRRFGDRLAGHLNDTLRPSLIGFQQVTMKELAERTLVQFRRVASWAAHRTDSTGPIAPDR